MMIHFCTALMIILLVADSILIFAFIVYFNICQDFYCEYRIARSMHETGFSSYGIFVKLEKKKQKQKHTTCFAEFKC